MRIKALKIRSLQCYEVKWIPFIGRDCILKLLHKRTYEFYYRLEEPCDGCAAPYGFRHIMPLTTDTTSFAVSHKSMQNLQKLWRQFEKAPLPKSDTCRGDWRILFFSLFFNFSPFYVRFYFIIVKEIAWMIYRFFSN